MRKILLVVIPIALFLFVIFVWFYRVPCGGMTKEGYFTDGTCPYGPILISNIRYKLSQVNKINKTCTVEEFELTFACPEKTTVQYWPNIFNSDFATITQKPIMTPQTTDELFHKDGFVLTRYALNPMYPSNIFIGEYLQKEAAAEKERIASGNLPQAPGPYMLVALPINIVPKWIGAVTAHTGMGDVVYMAIRNGFVYELRRNPTQGFSDQEITLMLATLAWSKL